MTKKKIKRGRHVINNNAYTSVAYKNKLGLTQLAGSLAKPLAVPLSVGPDPLVTRERDSPLKRDSVM